MHGPEQEKKNLSLKRNCVGRKPRAIVMNHTKFYEEMIK